MQADLELSSSQSLFSHEDEEKEFAEIAAKISEDLDFKLSFLKLSNEHEGEDFEEEQHTDRNEAEVIDDDDDDFTFVINGADSTTISGDGASPDAQIRPYFPLFNRDLLLAREHYKISENRLPSRPPVQKIFIQSPPSTSYGKGESNVVNGIATGPYSAWEKTSPELSKKSNSTGFSKLWRFKQYLHRSHSDGCDAFVFLNNSVTKKEAKSNKKKSDGDVKVNVIGEKKVANYKVKKTTPLSAHEVYLRSKGIYPENDKQRSYRHNKADAIGFYTNVNGGGLSKNVHPY